MDGEREEGWKDGWVDEWMVVNINKGMDSSANEWMEGQLHHTIPMTSPALS